MRYFETSTKAPVFIYIVSPGMDMVTPEFFNKIKSLTTKDFILCEYMANDWDSDLTPWPDSSSLKGRDFKGNASLFLNELSTFVKEELPISYPEHGDVFVVGYSLAGLFSLYSIYESDVFDGAVCCSGSLWYPSWNEYIENKIPSGKSSIYLSLGKMEPLTKNTVMKKVGEVTQKQYEILKGCPMVSNVVFEWNEGGHFAGASDRVSKGISWILEN